VPGAVGALVDGDRRGVQRRDQVRGLPGGGVDEHRPHRVRFVRHRRGSPRGAVVEFAEAGEGGGVLADRAEGIRQLHERVAEPGDGRTPDVPRCDRVGETEVAGETGRDVDAVRARGGERGEGAGGPAELHGVGGRGGLHRGGGRRDAARPTGELQSEGDRRRGLRERAADHDGVAVELRVPGERLDRRGGVGDDQLDGIPGHEGEGGVEGVLRGGSAVQPVRGLVVEARLQDAEQRDDRVASGARVAGDLPRRDVDPGGGDALGDPRGSGDRRQGGLEAHHGRDDGAVRRDRRHRRARPDGREQAGVSVVVS